MVKTLVAAALIGALGMTGCGKYSDLEGTDKACAMWHDRSRVA